MLSIHVLYQDERIFIGFLWHIALVVNEMVDGACLGGISTGKVFEVKAFLGQLLSAGKAFPVGIHLLQYRVIPSKDSIDFPYHIDLLVCFFVVVAVAARVTAEFLVDTADDRFTAIEAFSFFFFHIVSC